MKLIQMQQTLKALLNLTLRPLAHDPATQFIESWSSKVQLFTYRIYSVVYVLNKCFLSRVRRKTEIHWQYMCTNAGAMVLQVF